MSASLLEIIGQFYFDAFGLLNQFDADLLVDLIGELNDGVDFFEDFFLEVESHRKVYII